MENKRHVWGHTGTSVCYYEVIAMFWYNLGYVSLTVILQPDIFDLLKPNNMIMNSIWFVFGVWVLVQFSMFPVEMKCYGCLFLLNLVNQIRGLHPVFSSDLTENQDGDLNEHDIARPGCAAVQCYNLCLRTWFKIMEFY